MTAAWPGAMPCGRVEQLDRRPRRRRHRGRTTARCSSPWARSWTVPSRRVGHAAAPARPGSPVEPVDGRPVARADGDGAGHRLDVEHEAGLAVGRRAADPQALALADREAVRCRRAGRAPRRWRRRRCRRRGWAPGRRASRAASRRCRRRRRSRCRGCRACRRPAARARRPPRARRASSSRRAGTASARAAPGRARRARRTGPCRGRRPGASRSARRSPVRSWA